MDGIDNDEGEWWIENVYENLVVGGFYCSVLV